MASMSYATKTLFSISSDASIIGILIPNILTLILISRNWKKLKGNKRWLKIICTAVIVWIVVITAKFGLVEARSGLYTLYYIIIAYIQVRIFEKKLFLYFADIMVIMANLTLIMWLLGCILPPVADLYTMFPLSIENDSRTMDGYNVLYLFCWNNDPSSLFPRNAGFSWEPGRYAIMLALAILINLYHKGISFLDNQNLFWLLISLVSTRSTTGFLIVIVVFLYFIVKKIRFKYIFVGVILLIPIIYVISNIEFLGDKIIAQIDSLNYTESMIDRVQWSENNNPNYKVALERLPSMFFEFQNIQQDVITGYGPTKNQSYFSRYISEQASLTGGLLQIFGKYGILLGSLFYFILIISSVVIAKSYRSTKILGYFIFVLMSMVSYDIFCTAVFMSFWFYGVFNISRLTQKSKNSTFLKKNNGLYNQ